MTCQKCGAEMAAGARFCRRCAEPAPQHALAQSVLEAETRVFATEAEPSASTQHINAQMTGPAYMSPADMPAPPQAPVTRSLQSSSSTFKVLMLGVVLVLLVVPVALLIIMFLSKRTSSTRETPVVTVPEIPPPPAPPS